MRTRILFLLSAVAVGAACQTDDAAANRVTLGEAAEQQQQGGGLPAAIQTHIDEGNAAYRAKDYEGALKHYQAAAEQDPNQPTPWFGVAMAASAMGDEELAESARQRVQQLDPNLGAASHSAPAEAHAAPADAYHAPAAKPHP
jgi:tetratricopeptide (TPR) repeat protein